MTTKQHNQLFLHQEIMLLALHDEKGTVASSFYPYAIGGAVLAELLLRNVISLDSKHRMTLTNNLSLNDPFLDFWIEKIHSRKRRYSAKDFVYAVANTSKLKSKVAKELCKKGILKHESKKVLFFFDKDIFPERNSKTEHEIIKRLKTAIFTETKEVTAETAILVALANTVDLLNPIFGKKELKQRKKRMESIVKGNAANEATKAAIEQIQAVILVTCILPAVTTVIT
jgi:golgi phosphoprotein 3